MIEGKFISPRGWELSFTEAFEPKFTSKGELDFILSPNLDFVVIRQHEQIFSVNDSAELVTLRSIYLFGYNSPSIQLWRTEDHPPRIKPKLAANQGLLKINRSWFQDNYYKSVRIGDKWWRLENNEIFQIHEFKKSGSGRQTRITAIIIRVFPKAKPDAWTKLTIEHA